MWSCETISFNPSQGGATDPWAQLDGRLLAPQANIQFSTLLNPYGTGTNGPGGAGPPAKRYRWPTNFHWSNGNLIQPPWMVAGVDYPVGIQRDALHYPTNGSLKDPSSNTVLGGSLLTNQGSGTGNFNLYFASPLPSWVQLGMYAFDVQFGQIPFNATVQSITDQGNGTTQVTTNQQTNNFLGSGTEIAFSHYKGIYPQSSVFVLWVVDDNTIVDGWDLSVGNGWGMQAAPLGHAGGGNNLTVQNCNFSYGSNMVGGSSGGGGGFGLLRGSGFNFSANGGLVQFNEINGNGMTVNCRATLGVYGEGTITVQYNYIQQSGGELILGGDTTGGASYYIQYNVLQDAGAGQGTFNYHGDVVQCVPANVTQTLLAENFNLVIQDLNTLTTGAANQGFTTNGIGSTEPTAHITNYNIGNNTCVITDTGNMNEFASAGPTQTPLAQVTNNYVAPNTYSLTGGPGWVFLNNGTGNTTPPVDTGNVRMDNGATVT